ncbi:hypothetical protein BA70_09665 [Bacillus zhangzhouensis]|uniref:Uncharacterized protein n=1 Tax=Bacillus zhangzhouensis TaxID=1178540 RepID=A0A081L7T0_9BACI|nr:hypothetical protein BA70_09665 [Bacillus zhangzhouensis]
MHTFSVYTKILILNELRSYQRNRPYLYILFAINYILAPLFLGGLLAYFIKNLSIIYISFFIFLTIINLGRILFSTDKKQMAILMLYMDQYILGKDISKFFDVMLIQTKLKHRIRCISFKNEKEAGRASLLFYFEYFLLLIFFLKVL